MAYTPCYPNRINWQNDPSEATALNDVNLNKMDSAIHTIDGRVVDMSTRLDTDDTAITNLQGNVSNLQSDMTTAQGNITALQNGKVDKETGKGLSQVDNVTVTQHVAYGTVVSTIKTYKQDGTEVTSQVCNGVVVDSALSNSSTNPVQNKVVKSAIDEKSTVAISDTLADGDTIANVTIDGVTTPIKASKSEEMNVRSAMMLLTPPISNNAPYVKRVVGGGIANPYLCKLNKLIGASVVWNQLVKNGNFATNSNWSANRGTVAIANNKGTLTLTEVVKSNGLLQSCQTELNHIYFCTMSVTSPKSTKCAFFVGGNGGGDFVVNANTRTTSSAVLKATSTSTFLLLYCNIEEKLAVGDTVDYENVYVTDLTAMFGSTIADYVNTLETQTAGRGIAWLKSYGFFTEPYYAYSANTIQSVSVSTKVNKDSEDTTISTVALDHTELRGLFKLDANNNLYADGDIYPSDGTVARKYDIVDLGSLNYTKATHEQSGIVRFQATVRGLKGSGSNQTACNLLCAPYKNDTWSNVVETTNDKSICGLGSIGGIIAIQDSAYSSGSETAFKTAMNGVYLVYELATPTTETADGYTSLQNIESGGTEEFIDYGVEQGTRDVAIPCGQESEYNSGVSVPNLPTSGGKVELTYNPANGQFTWE